jgi:hypothetical protein
MSVDGVEENPVIALLRGYMEEDAFEVSGNA